jgi:hypothetical protein
MLKKMTSLLLNAARGIDLRPIAAPVTNAMNAPPKMLEGLAAAMAPKIAEELRHRPGSGALDVAAAQAALDTADMLLDAHIAELKISIEAQRREAQHLRQISNASELGIRVRNRLAEHRGEQPGETYNG